MVSRRIGRLLLLLGLAVPSVLRAQESPDVTLHLRNGDRLTGHVLSEDQERIVLGTQWNVAVSVPLSEIESRTVSTVPEPEPATPAPATGPAVAKVPSKPAPKPERPKRWRWDLKLGSDLVVGAKDRDLFYGQTSLTYVRTYEQRPKEFLRNKLEYRVDYGRTDGQETANRMAGFDKLDVDIGGGFYGYGSFGAGYDKVRKIEYQYELGPGLGYHLIAAKSLVTDVEAGLNYQYRRGLDNAPDRQVVQARLGQQLTWEVMPKITLTEQVAFLPFLDEVGEYQLRLEGNLGFGIVRHLSLNLTVMNFYDTMPAPGVPNNEFQFRSSLGVNF